MNQLIKDHWAVTCKGALYFFIAFLPAVIDFLNQVVQGQITEFMYLNSAKAFLCGILSGLIAIRAYTDGSMERHINDIKETKNENISPTI